MRVSAFRSQVRQVVNGIELTPTHIRWFDDDIYERSTAETNSAPISADAVERDSEALVEVLKSVLYSQFYTTSRPMLKLELALQTQSGPSGSIASSLVAANSGAGRWDRDWRCVSIRDSGAEVVVQRDGLTLLARRDQVRTVAGAQAAFDELVSIRTPAGSLSRWPGFYVAHSDHPLDYSQLLSRVYVNVTASQAPDILKDVTSTLNYSGFPFDFKVANDTAHYYRCDVAVLYVPRVSFLDVFKELAPVFQRHRHSIRPVLPPFVCQLLPGVGGADDPANGESFGVDRCGRLAAAVIKALGIPAGEERINVVVDVVASSGVDPERPYLSPGSNTDVYCALT